MNNSIISLVLLGFLLHPLHARADCFRGLSLDSSGHPIPVRDSTIKDQHLDFYLFSYSKNNEDLYSKINGNSTLRNLVSKLRINIASGTANLRWFCRPYGLSRYGDQLWACKNTKTGLITPQESHPYATIQDVIDGRKVTVFSNTVDGTLGADDLVSYSCKGGMIQRDEFRLLSVRLLYDGQTQYLPYLAIRHNWSVYSTDLFKEKAMRFNF